MTVADTTRRAGPYQGSGSTTEFAFAFKVFKASDLYVAQTTDEGETALTLGTDYTVKLNSDQDLNPGGTITLKTALPDGQYLSATSKVDYDQLAIFANKGGFYPETLNDCYDKLTILCQQLKEQVSRAITTDITDTMSPSELKNKLLTVGEDAAKSAASAAGSASAAATSATSAATSATSAATSATSAATSLEDVKAYAKQAEENAIAASTSETAAGRSAQVASGYADEARESKQSAATSATTAASKASAAETSATEASASASAAANSAGQASASATAAATSATTATEQAEIATAAADRATAGQIQANWTETDTTSKAYIQNKPALKPVATSGSYNDLDNKPSPIQYVAQTLTTVQKTQARTNIDAVSESELKTALSELIVEYGGTVPTD